MTTTHGDEPGVEKGVKSGTVGDVVEPVTSSEVVSVNGYPAQRHGDECTLNNGNCPGEYVHVQSTEVDQAPDGRDAADKAKDNRSVAGKAFDGFYENSSEAQAIDAGLKRLGDYTGDPTLIGKDLQSAWEAVPSADEALEFGENVATGVGNATSYAWNNPSEAATGVWNWGVDGLSGLWTGVTDAYDKGGVSQAGGHLAAAALGVANPFKKAKWAHRAAEGLEDLGDAAKAERLAREAREAEERARKAERATEDGSPGARSTRWEPKNVNGRRVYQRDDLIDPNKKDARGRTNKQRMEQGLAPIGPDGKPINLHHVTQTEPGPLAEVSQTQHQQYTRQLHMPDQVSFRNDPVLNSSFESYRRNYWITRSKDF